MYGFEAIICEHAYLSVVCLFAGPLNAYLYQQIIIQNKATDIIYLSVGWGMRN